MAVRLRGNLGRKEGGGRAGGGREGGGDCRKNTEVMR